MKFLLLVASVFRQIWKRIKRLIKALLAFRGWIDWATPERRRKVFPAAAKSDDVMEADARRIDQYDYG